MGAACARISCTFAEGLIMANFPTTDPTILRPMFDEIGGVVASHLGVRPESFVLILTDGTMAQTLFAGDDATELTRLLTEAADNHSRHGGAATQ